MRYKRMHQHLSQHSFVDEKLKISLNYGCPILGPDHMERQDLVEHRPLLSWSQIQGLAPSQYTNPNTSVGVVALAGQIRRSQEKLMEYDS